MAILNKFLRLILYVGIFSAGLLGSLYLTSKWIIQSEEEVVVPNLVGHDTVYALDLLTSLGLNIKVSGFMWSDAVPKNFIASQEPTSGTRIKRDRDVRVVLSRGSRSVRVPNIVGSSLREAELVLSQNGLKLGGSCRLPSENHAINTVISQRPLPLQELERGQQVDLLISNGPKPDGLVMPEMRLQPVAEAIETLGSLDLRVTTIKTVHRPGEPLDTVVSQRPPAGYRVDATVLVTLTVNRLPGPGGQQAKLWWLTYQVPEGYFKKEVVLSQNLDGEEMILYRKIHRPGEVVEWFVWAQSLKEVSIFVDGMLQKAEFTGFHWKNVGKLDHLPGEEAVFPYLFRDSWRAS
jgi:serine/threonine-protein kinase